MIQMITKQGPLVVKKEKLEVFTTVKLDVFSPNTEDTQIEILDLEFESTIISEQKN